MPCNEFLQKKIKKNVNEFPTRKQAIAVSYSQTLKAKPECKSELTKKTKKKKKKTTLK